ncbi:phage tail fiber protein [Klebsiella michiganensis]|uniref:phage tail fiber domain-containing protein n=1 Tax=Klebsiella michiganensis TaxID=1134687 RepID=UPI003862B6CC
MSVPNQTPYNIYTANGLTTVFAYEFYLISASDIQVTINGNEVTSGYTVSGVGNTGGGEVTFLTAPANGSTVIFERVTPTYRLTDYQDNGDLLADTVNKDFDRLWMAIQRAFIYLGVALTRPLFGGGPFNANGYRIANLADPVNDQDAATKKYVLSAGNTNLVRTLRVPESYIDVLPSVVARRNSLLGWNSSGRPVPIFSWTDTADLALKLVSNELPGGKLVSLEHGTVNDAITYLTPEMFGAKGDGVTDDYYAIQKMLNEGPSGCTFVFDGSKTYYNAFGNKTPSDAWVAPEDRIEWKRSLPATFRFNGAKIRRRKPFWNDNNLNNNNNTGAYYTDDHTALLHLSGEGPYYIYDPDFDGGLTTGALKDLTGATTGQTNYAIGTCLDFGLLLDNCTNVTVKGGIFKNSVFPIYVDTCTDIDIDTKVRYAAQAQSRITPTDLAYGGGCKVLNSSDVRLYLRGRRNVNTTAEIESLNSNVTVKGWSDLDYSNSLVIFGSQYVHLDWIARNVQNGVGVYIRGGFSLESNFITGRVIIDSASYYGCYVYLAASASTDMYGIELNIQSRNCGSHGLYINAESGSGHIIDGVDITHQSSGDDGGAARNGAPTRVNGLVKGEIKINPSNAFQGFWASGNNSADTSCVVRFSGNTRGATNKWTITSTMRVDVDIITNTNHYRLTCAQFIDTGAITAGGGFDNSNSYVRTYGRFSQDQATYPLFPKMKGAVSGANYELVYDPADFVIVEGAKKYNVQLVILN